eukprot:6208227-Pleurochrysis_carterae.AAC.1
MLNDVGMPHADHVIASGPAGGRLSPHRKFAAEGDSPEPGVSQIRVIHCSRSEIVRLHMFYRESPDISVLDGDNEAYLRNEQESFELILVSLSARAKCACKHANNPLLGTSTQCTSLVTRQPAQRRVRGTVQRTVAPSKLMS